MLSVRGGGLYEGMGRLGEFGSFVGLRFLIHMRGSDVVLVAFSWRIDYSLVNAFLILVKSAFLRS